MTPTPDAAPRQTPAAWHEFARAPLVPVAVAATVGLCLDRYALAPLGAELAVAAVGLVAWAAGRGRGWLLLAAAGLFAGHHHTQKRTPPAHDIARCVRDGPRLVRVRGVLLDDPVTRFAPRHDPLEPRLRSDSDGVLMLADSVATADGWGAAGGRVRVSVERDAPAAGAPPDPPLLGLRAGDAVEVLGLLSVPGPPRNPGERDTRRTFADRGIRAELRVSDAGVVTRLDAGGRTLAGTLAAARRGATDALANTLPAEQLGPAAALLLGDGNAMDQAAWDAYVRTGVVHALAISGQHLAVLAGVLWFVARALNVRRVRAAWLVVAVVCGYALLTGLRPSGVRAAVMVAGVCGGVVLRRPARPANGFALAWLVTAAVDPADPFTLGSQLSYLSVFVLIWGVGPRLAPRDLTPIEQLVDDSRSPLERFARGAARAVGHAYAVTVALGVANAPLQLADQNLVSPAGLVIGPAVVFLTEVGLVAGFLLVLVAPVPGLSDVVALPVRVALAGCDGLVRLADSVPGGAVYRPGVALWWLAGFYAGVAVAVLAPRPWPGRALLGLAAWTVGGLLLPTGPARPAGEMRLCVLAVGKGACAVAETPDGRCLVFDVGTTAGPAAVRRVVAPYLWSRGIERVDELFLSHADYDHFNGVGELARRFPIGRVTLTPSFADKQTREVAGAIEALRRHGLRPAETASAGQARTAGDVLLEVLHPPRDGPAGTENERSLVVRLRHANHAVLLTGDLEKAGTTALLAQPPLPAAVLLAPHHGSRTALPPGLVAWCRPKLVVVSRGPPLGNSVTNKDAPGVPVWDTHAYGAVTIKSHATGLVAETFATGERVVVERGGR